MAALDDLKRILPPPRAHRREAIDWAAVEAQVGIRLPLDYKDFVGEYGLGSVDTFLLVFHPTTPDTLYQLPQQAVELSALLRQLRGQGASGFPYAIFPEPGGVLPWGTTENADYLFWRTEADDPSLWTVTVNESHSPEWDWFPGSLTEWLLAILTRRLVCPFFPRDFPSDHPVFVPLED